MNVDVHLLHKSQPIEHVDVRNVYTKGPLVCVMQKNGMVSKYPVRHVFRIVEWEPS
jgi:hypothetical protein